MSRRSRRNRHRPQRAAVAKSPAIPSPATLDITGNAIIYSGDQVRHLLTTIQRRGNTAALMPRPESWTTDPFGPAKPLPPSPINITRPDSGRADPRAWEYPVAENIQLSAYGHVPWKTLQSAANQSLFRKCIEIRKGVCELDFQVTVDPAAVARYASTSGDAKTDIEAGLRKKHEADIARITAFFAEPDRKNGYDWTAWTSLIMENQLKYDAVAIYPQYSMGGELLWFRVIDGKTIKVLQDEYGERPLPPAPAYQQILYGWPRGEWTATTAVGADGKPYKPGFASDQLFYARRIVRSETPYGMSPTEIALIDGWLWTKRHTWMINEYTEGVQPDSFLVNKGELDWTPEQVTDYERYLNNRLAGNTAERYKWPMLPPGVEPVQSAAVADRYKADYDLFLIKLLASAYGVPASELGFPETGALGASFHEGDEDILYRRTRIPDANFIGKIASRLAVQHLAMSTDLSIKILGLESEDEAAADAVAQEQVATGRRTLNEDRSRTGLPPYGFAEADMPMLQTARGVVFLEGASAQAPPGVLIGPAMAAPTSAPPGAPPVQQAAEPPPAAPKSKQKPKDVAKHAVRSIADDVYAQLAEDYPKTVLDWVHHVDWSGPRDIPLDKIDFSQREDWAASKEPKRVEHLKGKIQAKQDAGKHAKPAVLIHTPDADRLMVADGHHRTLAYEDLGQPVWAYVGETAHKVGPWDVLHNSQFDTKSGSDTAATTGKMALRHAAAHDVDDEPRRRHIGALPAEARAELSRFRAFAKRRSPSGRPFEFRALTKALAAEFVPGLLGDPRAVLKDDPQGQGDVPPPKALAGGRAGSGT